MKRRLSLPVFRLTVVLALVVALVGAAWAHRGPSLEMTEDVLVYVAAGGSLEDICASEGSAGFAHQTCDACRLVDAVSFAGAADCPVALAVLARAGVGVPDAAQTYPSIHDPVRQSRAPPRLI